MKKLTQAVFDGAPDWVASAAIDEDGSAVWYSSYSCQLLADKLGGEHHINAYVEDLPNYPEHLDKFKLVGIGYDPTDWQDSAIDRF